MTSGAMLGGHTKAIFGEVFEAVGLETERRLAVKVTELEKMRLQALVEDQEQAFTWMHERERAKC